MALQLEGATQAPKIDSYEFGRIVIDGKGYVGDILIYNNSIHSPWWRANGHNLVLDDLKDLLKSKPSKLIIGTGYSGMMNIDSSVIDFCKDNNIELVSAITEKAVELFNESPTAAAFHLTC